MAMEFEVISVRRRLSVDVASVADVKGGHYLFTVVNLVDDAVAAYSDAPSVATCQLETAGWSGVWGLEPSRQWRPGLSYMSRPAIRPTLSERAAGS